MMGSPESEAKRVSYEGPQRRVRITRPFYFGVYEVTQSEYERVMGSNPGAFTQGGRARESKPVSALDTSRLPVETVSWADAVEFCRLLSAMSREKSAGRVYRLPTEAEWEFSSLESSLCPNRPENTVKTGFSPFRVRCRKHPQASQNAGFGCH